MIQHNFNDDFELFESEGSKAALAMTPEWAEGFIQTLEYAKNNYDSPETGQSLELQEAQIKLLLRSHDLFKEHMSEIASQYAYVTGQNSPDGEPEFHGDSIEWSWSEPCRRGCCSDYYSLTMPTHILWTPRSEWEAEYRAEQKRKAEAEAAKKAEEKRKREEAEAKAQEARDKADYARLKAKFESGNSS